MMADYHINIFYSEEDGGYIADIPDLESCSAFGDTPEEALAEVNRAKEAWLQAARDAGKPIPPPQYRPAIYRASH
jgi:predicted RNase H-like HicB family nuclease